MELDKYMGRTVLLNVTDDFARENEPLFQSAPRARLLYAKVIALGELGLWVENPAWKSRPARGGDTASHRAHVLVPFRALVSVATFPDRQFPQDEPIDEQDVQTIGFTGKETQRP